MRIGMDGKAWEGYPHNIEAEVYVLAAVLVSPEPDPVFESVSGREFFIRFHGWLFDTSKKAIRSRRKCKHPVEHILREKAFVRSRFGLDLERELRDLGREVAQGSVLWWHGSYYGWEVRRLAAARKRIQQAESEIRAAWDATT